MHRIRFIHWKPEESAERAERIRAAGYEVDNAPFTPSALKKLRTEPPDAVVIDLERLPAQGRDLGVALRTHSATRGIPLVLLGGEPEKVNRIKEVLPDAQFAQWTQVRSSLKRAIRHPVKDPVVHKSVFAGYSGTPLFKKLGIKAYSKVVLLGAPPSFEETLGALPEGVTIRRRAVGNCDLTIWFTRRKIEVERRIKRLGSSMGTGGLWVVWPKKASGEKSDLTQAEVRRIGLASGLVDYKVCSVDQTWTGLKFTKRKHM
jgi:hypothetical protein